MERELIQKQILAYHPKTSLTVICKGRVVSIGFDELICARKFGNEVLIYTDKSEYRTRYSLQDILNDLPVNEFFRVHKSHIISLKKIKTISGNTVSLVEYKVPLSKYYKVQMIKQLGEMLEKKYSWFRQA